MGIVLPSSEELHAFVMQNGSGTLRYTVDFGDGAAWRNMALHEWLAWTVSPALHWTVVSPTRVSVGTAVVTPDDPVWTELIYHTRWLACRQGAQGKVIWMKDPDNEFEGAAILFESGGLYVYAHP